MDFPILDIRNPGLRNFAHNGNTDTFGRRITITSTGTSFTSYVADRFKFQKNAATAQASVAQSATVAPQSDSNRIAARRGLTFTVTTPQASLAAGEVILPWLQQHEGLWVKDLAGNDMFTDFMANATAGQYAFFVRSASGSMSVVIPFTVLATGIWQKISIRIPALPFSIVADTSDQLHYGVCAGAGTSFQAPSAGVWAAGNFTALSTTQNIAATNGQFFTMNNLRFGLSPDAPFTLASLHQYSEDMLLKRYFEKTHPTDSIPTAAGINAVFNQTANGSSSVSLAWRFSTVKRTAPLVTYYSNITGAVNNIRNSTAGSDLAAATQANTTEHGASTNLNTATANNVYVWNATAESDF